MKNQKNEKPKKISLDEAIANAFRDFEEYTTPPVDPKRVKELHKHFDKIQKNNSKIN